jgi:hypothetical protein
MSTLNQIGLKYGTDKASEVHDYLKKYEKYLPYKREDKLNILEIGVLNGESLTTWKEYFYNSTIIGIDINPDCKKYQEDRVIVETGDQTDKFFLDGLIKKYGPFDFILDDGSHINNHVLTSFELLFKSVKSGGQYIIEDVQTSYLEDYGGGYMKLGTTIEYFKNIIDEVNFYGQIVYGKPVPLGRRDDYLLEYFEKNNDNRIGFQIESINFLNSIIIINKR